MTILNLPGNTHVAADKEQLFEDLGKALLSAAIKAVEARGVFHMALSGGGTPEPFYIRMVTDPMFRAFPWEQTHIWIVDERQVAEDHEKSNIRMIREAMTSQATIPSRQVHAMPVLTDDPAGEYEGALSEAFGMQVGDGIPAIDFILLGMGGDNHTASLFPQSPALQIMDRWIATNDGELVVPPPRVTMTYPLINHGRELVVLLAGAGKYEALKILSDQLEQVGPDIENLPISGIDPSANGGTLTWYLDEAAATGA